MRTFVRVIVSIVVMILAGVGGGAILAGIKELNSSGPADFGFGMFLIVGAALIYKFNLHSRN